MPVGVTALPPPLNEPEEEAALVVHDYLTGRGLNSDVALENGWYPSVLAGDQHLRIVMPATNTKGYVYWQARAVSDNVDKRYQSPSYAASDSIIIVWPSGKFDRRAVVVEGPMDALAAAEHGHVGIALMGKSPDSTVYDHIADLFRCYKFQVIPDADDIQAGSELALQLMSRGLRTSLTVCPAKDLAAVPRFEREALLA
jgi:hypothetical protein